jgi:hypothetical protein
VDFPKVLRPGQVGTIRIKVETGKAAGPHTKTVTIRTNDPSETSHVVNFKFDVKG